MRQGELGGVLEVRQWKKESRFISDSTAGVSLQVNGMDQKQGFGRAW